MIKDVIRAIERGQVSRKEDLAALTGMDVSAVDGMLDLLVRKEYLRVTDPSVVDAGCDCGHCGKRSCCVTGNKTYTLTEKGKQLVGSSLGAR